MKQTILMKIYNHLFKALTGHHVEAAALSHDHFLVSIEGRLFKVSIEETGRNV